MDIAVGSTLTWAWPIILTAVALVLTAVVNQAAWTAQAKKITTIIVAGLVGAVYAVAAGLITEVPQEWSQVITVWLVNAAIILVCGQGVYTFVKNPLAKLEAATSITPAPADADGDLEDVTADMAADVSETAGPPEDA